MFETNGIETTAEALLLLLRERGIEYLFGNAGTDAAPLIEAFAKIKAEGKKAPIPVTAPHEMSALSMAHGYAMTTGKPASVFVHVNVGTANAAVGIMNASRLNIPMLILSGRTPIHEAGVPGAREGRIHWAQESYDQASMIREFVKWDYELRDFRQLEVVVDRALAMATNPPGGPVYLMLPRERLLERPDGMAFHERNRLASGADTQPDPASIERAAELIFRAKRPIAIAGHAGREPETVADLVSLAETCALPVVEVSRHSMNFPADHPLHLGFSADPYLAESDLILVIESDAPWFPHIQPPRPDTPVIQIGRDPLYSRYPVRGFPLDVSLIGHPALSLRVLRESLQDKLKGKESDLASRKAELAARHDAYVSARRQAAENASTNRPISMDWLSRCLGEAAPDGTIFINEYTLRSDQLHLNEPGSFFGCAPVSGLGWAFGAAIGAKLGAPEKTVICGMGDGAYIFGNPVASHMAAASLKTPLLAVVFNNRRWNAVRASVGRIAPDGWAVSRDDFAFVDLLPSPEFEKISEACGGYGERVEEPAELPAAIQRGLKEVREKGRHALLNVMC